MGNRPKLVLISRDLATKDAQRTQKEPLLPAISLPSHRQKFAQNAKYFEASRPFFPAPALAAASHRPTVVTFTAPPAAARPRPPPPSPQPSSSFWPFSGPRKS